MKPEIAKMLWDEAKQGFRKKMRWANFGAAWNAMFSAIEFWLIFHQGDDVSWSIVAACFSILFAGACARDVRRHKYLALSLKLMEDKEREWEEVGNRPW